ncbi:MAG: type II toxin-antitoxin system RelE/ParE family toxin [Melioribacteraceae bacterium]|nr:type II toxin-antitoxin system RelE/ParE family toxin [Melioribacteraceae bacterium]MCF8263009.1 type II toxin-antitoxin system RelE/ParE family toxin [Melioribacteraceae bacterium]MCF8430454.1 type II toxin-antitoxin system RelE/ParE family toxin [Melioribacteraceae bacterium]
MAKYKIQIKKSAAKEIKKIPQEYLVRILTGIDDLSKNPRPSGCTKLTNDEKYRIRVGDYRILYQIFENSVTVTVVKSGHRKDVYQK